MELAREGKSGIQCCMSPVTIIVGHLFLFMPRSSLLRLTEAMKMQRQTKPPPAAEVKVICHNRMELRV